MKIIHLIAMTTILLLFFIYNKFIAVAKVTSPPDQSAKKPSSNFFILIGLALVLRIVGATLVKGYEADMNCFLGWSQRIFHEGLANFYSETEFSDYPPGYMYVLYFLGGIRQVFHLEYNSIASIILTKLPAILCDFFTAAVIYKFAKRRFNDNISTLCCALYLFNPAIIINSTIWGQVDSVFTLAIVLMCFYISEKKLPYAYVIFGIGVLIKPQTLIVAPILIFGIIDQVFLTDFNFKKFLFHLKWGVGAILLMVMLVLPFGFTKVINQYFNTLASYPYASVNAYNMWSMFGLNWASQTGKILFLTYNQWGTLIILSIVAVATYFNFKAKKNDSKYFLIASFIVIEMFTFSVRMHERYMFPALVLLLIAFLIRPKKELFLMYSLFSVVHFYNVAHVLFVFDVNNFNQKDPIPILLGGITVLLVQYFNVILKKRYLNENDSNIDNKNQFTATRKSKRKDQVKAVNIKKSRIVKIRKIDFVILSLITIIYAGFALYDLGDRKAPQTSWDSNTSGESILLDFGEVKQISKISYYLGNFEKRKFSLYTSDTAMGPFDHASEIEMDSVFSWGTYEINVSTRYLKLESMNDKMSLRELVFLDETDQILIPVNNRNSTMIDLFDEQSLYPVRNTFRESTYFDEIYHARTAYEYINGLYSYENTHPPLGKIFIALGMLIFGVNPFGWRIMGTIFGIAMVPLMYLFAKKLFRKTWLASIVCLLFTFDFMHFTQTRIATIDVFVTFFIILMYYFMYQYYQSSFYDIGLRKTLIPLGICGVVMGLAISCKWTGVYAGVGLAILFFLTLYRRYKEYKYAVSCPLQSTNGIKHQHVIANFSSNSKKTILFCCVFFVVIPIIIYTLSYLPFVDGDGSGLILRMIKNQEAMFSYHSAVNSTHPYSSRWYEWPIMTRPIWYYSGHISDTVSEGISAFGNPLVWWVGIVAFLYMIYLSVMKKDKKAIFLTISYLSQYLPWLLVSRITFIYHYFPSVAFVTLMIGYAIDRIVKYNRRLKQVSFIYVAVVIVLFFMFYPVLSGQGVNKDYVSIWLRWFDTWVLVS